jgi:hypothetical protein
MTISENRDGLPIEDGQNVGLTAGMSKDGRTSLHDKVIPATIRATWTNPENPENTEERDFDLRESHDYHERIERALMDAGMEYLDAHRWATECEHARQRQQGFNPNQIEETAAPYIDAAAHRARAEGRAAPAELDEQPYVDGGDTDLLNRDTESFEHAVFDRDGNRYINPRQLRLLDSFDSFVACSEGDGSYAVLEPSTGMLLAHGHELDSQAVEAANLLAARRGTLYLKRWIESEPALSQQQLQARFSKTPELERSES